MKPNPEPYGLNMYHDTLYACAYRELRLGERIPYTDRPNTPFKLELCYDKVTNFLTCTQRLDHQYTTILWFNPFGGLFEA